MFAAADWEKIPAEDAHYEEMGKFMAEICTDFHRQAQRWLGAVQKQLSIEDASVAGKVTEFFEWLREGEVEMGVELAWQDLKAARATAEAEKEAKAKGRWWTVLAMGLGAVISSAVGFLFALLKWGCGM